MSDFSGSSLSDFTKHFSRSSLMDVTYQYIRFYNKKKLTGIITESISIRTDDIIKTLIELKVDELIREEREFIFTYYDRDTLRKEVGSFDRLLVTSRILEEL